MVARNITVMFTDIVGFTSRVSDSRREEMIAFRRMHEQLLVPVIRYFAGIVVDRIGDAFFVRFDSPTNAVLCGVTIQEVLRQLVRRAPGHLQAGSAQPGAGDGR